MRVFKRILPIAACIATLSLADTATADSQGKGQAQSKQADKAQKKEKNAKPAKARPTEGKEREENMRFEGLDRNSDGIVTRAEWRGNDTSFRNQDWNGDGVLSGDEIRPGAARPGRSDEDDRVTRWDINRDGMLSRGEWQGTTEAFNRLDVNRDGLLTKVELTAPRPR
jgi:Ca2+-binding EF-hand superfamily protein